MGVTKDEDTNCSVSKKQYFGKNAWKNEGRNFSRTCNFKKQYYILFAKFPPWQSVSIWRSYAFWTCFYAAAITSNANRFLTAAAVVAGMATGGARTELYTALTFMVLFSLFTKLLKIQRKKKISNMQL